MYVPDEPPYLLHDTTYANEINGSRPQYMKSPQATSKPLFSASGSEISELNRIVIDDLTIKNRRLREKLRKYESPYNPDLDKDRAFELKIHRPMRPKQRRALEEALRVFAASMDGWDSDSEPKRTTSSNSSRLVSTPDVTQPSSYSPPVPSPPPSPSFHESNMSMRVSPSTSKENLLRSAPHITPNDDQVEDLTNLPRDLTHLSDMERMKLIVRRLEGLFTGKVTGIVGGHIQALQQQEISKPQKGVREAVIKGRDSDNESMPPNGSPSSEKSKENTNKDNQRPTQPLDLDPDRAQVPSDNIAHIKHLHTGLSTPQLGLNINCKRNSSEGWIYLNVLYGMAQLHHINITHDFTRFAVAEYSDKLELHPDGQRIRWRGGTEGTHLSSDSDGPGGQSRNVLGEPNKKYRKRTATQGQFSSTAKQPVSAASHHKKSDPLFYKSLFPHPKSDAATSPGSSSDSSTARRNRMEWQSHFRSQRSGTSSSTPSKRRRDDGPIVFYKGAQFCTDLSGDRGGIRTPLHITKVGNDGLSTRTTDVVGFSSRNTLSLAPSGSHLPPRPLREFSYGSERQGSEETQPSTPQSPAGGEYMDLNFPSAFSLTTTSPKARMQEFPASGLGGTKPADHFSVTVTTRRRKASNKAHRKRSLHPSSRSNVPRFIHRIIKESLDTLRPSDEDLVTQKLGSLSADSPPCHNSNLVANQLPMETEVISTSQFQPLNPSQLPPPSRYYAPSSSSSYDGSSVSESSFGIIDVTHLTGRAMACSVNRNFSSIPNNKEATGSEIMYIDEDSREGDVSGEIDDDDESNESIDMLAHARQANPEFVAAQEKEFEMEGRL